MASAKASNADVFGQRALEENAVASTKTNTNVIELGDLGVIISESW